MRPKPKDSPHPKIFQSPAAAAAAASVTAAYALTKSGAFDFNRTEDSNLKVIQKNGSQHDLSIEINAIREEKKVLESAFEDVRAENSSLKGKVDETASTYVDLSKVCLVSWIADVGYRSISQWSNFSSFLPILSRNSTQSKDSWWLRGQDVLNWRFAFYSSCLSPIIISLYIFLALYSDKLG